MSKKKPLIVLAFLTTALLTTACASKQGGGIQERNLENTKQPAKEGKTSVEKNPTGTTAPKGKWVQMKTEEVTVINPFEPLLDGARALDKGFKYFGDNVGRPTDITDGAGKAINAAKNGLSSLFGGSPEDNTRIVSSSETTYGYAQAPQTPTEARLQQLFATPTHSNQLSAPRIDMGATNPNIGLLTYEMTNNKTGLIYRVSSQNINGDHQMIIQEWHPSLPYTRELRGSGIVSNPDPQSFDPRRDVRLTGGMTEDVSITKNTPPTQEEARCGNALIRAGAEQNTVFATILGSTAHNENAMFNTFSRQLEADREADAAAQQAEKKGAGKNQKKYQKPKLNVMNIGG